MKMKKILGIILSVIMLCSTVTAFAQASSDKVTVTMDGQEMEFDVQPVIENGRTLVPMRAIFEALGCAVTYYDNGEFPVVMASRGDNFVIVFIGQDFLITDKDEITLDVPAKIVNDRTLVPLRAVSEAFDTKVEWLEDIKTVCLYTKHGMHKIKSAVISKEIKNKIGIKVMDIACTYPVIENPENLDWIEKLNKEYRENAEKYAADVEKEYAEKANQLCEETGIESFYPFEFKLTYTIDTDRNGLFSLTNHYSENIGDSQEYRRESAVYNTETGEKLTLSDIVSGDDDERHTMAYDVFVKYFEEKYTDLSPELASQIDKATENTKFYLTDNSLVLYFDMNQLDLLIDYIPTVELKYNEGLFKIDLSDAELDSLVIDLEGNPTTGYQWKVISADADKLEVKDEYIPDENKEGLVGKGGTYRFTAHGIGEGNCSIDIAYMRGWESSNEAIDEITYYLYVSKDGKITVLGTEKNLDNVKYDAE